ncbi:hypothetical protein LWI29_007357 [Acer saccharum]|uniref:Uncharacterized protein n=1 Tax=Acer saccharum TaxID=4024 RepID=A0AA39W839_ACESA|nr:hypothetical protein LWI29_007357 [Acer saccharum]
MWYCSLNCSCSTVDSTVYWNCSCSTVHADTVHTFQPFQDDCRCSWLKPSRKQIEKSGAATKPQGTIRKGQGNKNSWFVPEMEPKDSKPREGNSNGDAPKVQQWQGMAGISNRNSKGRSDAPILQQGQETAGILNRTAMEAKNRMKGVMLPKYNNGREC